MIHRVLMTADAVGGVWTYALDLVRALRQYDIEVHVATMGPLPSVDQKREAAGIRNLTLHQSSYDLEWMCDPWDDVSAAGKWLLDLSRQIHPDVVHLNGFCHASLPWNAPVVVVGHSCVLSWWRAVKQDHAPSTYKRYGFEVAKGLRAADAVVAPTQAMLNELVNCYGPHRNARAIPNACRIEPEPVPKESFILSAGRLWDEAKNVAALEAIADDLDWPVRIAGDGGDEATSRFRIGRLTREQLARQMSRAAIYALPVRYEPFGLSILEAATCGCALVLGDIPSLRENWNDAAVFVDPERPDRLLEALRGLIECPSVRYGYAWRASQRARQFSLENMAASYRSLYNELAPCTIGRPSGVLTA